jgi:hypothetical protein
MAAGFREGFVETDGFRIRYMEAGEGRDVCNRRLAAGAYRQLLPCALRNLDC